MNRTDTYRPGDIVHVIIRNPHAQDVAHVQEAAVVQHPEEPGELALFVYETYYPLTDEVAIYQTKHEAEEAYQEAFGSPEVEEYHG